MCLLARAGPVRVYIRFHADARLQSTCRRFGGGGWGGEGPSGGADFGAAEIRFAPMPLVPPPPAPAATSTPMSAQRARMHTLYR